MTTNDEQYVPTDGPVRYQYVVNRMREGATRTHAEREYTRWLAAHDARVRRDAAREALSRLADISDVRDGDGVKGRLGSIIRIWRDAHYPKTED